MNHSIHGNNARIRGNKPTTPETQAGMEKNGFNTAHRRVSPGPRGGCSADFKVLTSFFLCQYVESDFAARMNIYRTCSGVEFSAI